MRSPALPIFGCLALVLLQGCLWPSKTIHSAVYRGRISDAATKQPVSKARIELRGAYSLTSSSTSKSSGEFAVGPLDCCLYVPVGEGRVPSECKHLVSDNTLFSLEISRSGYEPAQVLVPMYSTNWSHEVYVGDIALRPEDHK